MIDSIYCMCERMHVCLSIYRMYERRILLQIMFVCLCTVCIKSRSSVHDVCLSIYRIVYCPFVFICVCMGGAGRKFAVCIVWNILHNRCFPDGILNCITLEFKLHNS